MSKALARVASLALVLGAFLAAAPGRTAWAGPSPLITLGPGDALALSPFWNWKTITTPHFRLTFPAELEKTARRAGDHLERAHQLLAPRMRWEPRLRTQVLVVDNTDSANGLTTPIQRFGIILQVTPPENWFSTAWHDDWLRLLCIHEYTHTLNMDPTRGPVYEALRVLFGDLFLPNTLWPDWMLEGTAVFMETRFTGAGRGRSAYWNAILRATVLENQLGSAQAVPLDRAGGPTPYFPGGETAYLYGYGLMTEASRPSRTLDGLGGADLLGELSSRSSERVPFFVNGNLENTSGRDWYQTWQDWTAGVQSRAGRELEQLRTAPVTRARPLTKRGLTVEGLAASPDGRWLAFGRTGLDEVSGLYLLDRATGETRKLADKLLGAAVSFTPDSRFVLHSSMRRRGFSARYDEFSDLEAIEIPSGRRHWLSEGLRARDPNVSPDGKHVAFTLADQQTVGLAWAELRVTDQGQPELGPVERLWSPGALGRVSTPRFTRDGSTLIFTLQENGKAQEDLMELHPGQASPRTLLSDGSFNRFPALAPDGSIHFVSNRTGVFNLWRLEEPGRATLETNTLTALWFPAFTPEGSAVAASLGASGWEVAQVPLSRARLSPDQLTLPPPEVPAAAASDLEAPVLTSGAPTEDYSPWPSLAPRQWAPLVLMDSNGDVSAGAEIFGFDAVDRHRYLLLGAYQFQVQKPEGLAIYQNRSLGPTLSLAAQSFSSRYLGPSVEYVKDDVSVTGAIFLPFRFTFSTLTPSLELTSERTTRHTGPLSPFATDQLELLNDATARVVFTTGRSSRLSVSQESGSRSELGARLHFLEPENVWKGYASHTQYLQLADHWVFQPRIQGLVASRKVSDTSSTNAVVSGRSGGILGSFSSDGLDELRVRGYPGQTYYSKAASLLSGDLVFPLARIFRGWGTNPLYTENLTGFLFAENAWFPVSGTNLPAVGGGAKLELQVFHRVPIEFSVQYHQGFNVDLGGTGELFFLANLGSLNLL